MKRLASEHWHVFVEAFTENLDEAISRDLVQTYNDNKNDLTALPDQAFVMIDKKKQYIEELNTSLFRSDEFKTEHDGLHLLFSGDSVTFGEGLNVDEIWANIVYSEVSKSHKTSGYFNLAVPGTGSPMHIINMFKYFKKYGNPDYIFFNMSEMHRFYDYLPDIGMFTHKIYSNLNMPNLEEMEKDSWVNTLRLLNFNLYFMLEQYCRSNNIKLFSFSWDLTHSEWNHNAATNILMDSWGFETFHNIDTQENIRELYKLETQTFKDHPYARLARDNAHQGVAVHKQWSDIVMKWFRSLDHND